MKFTKVIKAENHNLQGLSKSERFFNDKSELKSHLELAKNLFNNFAFVSLLETENNKNLFNEAKPLFNKLLDLVEKLDK